MPQLQSKQVFCYFEVWTCRDDLKDIDMEARFH